jgi:organic hydroperoxide reductase OsmC/OhrA
MARRHSYETSVTWTGNRGTGTSGYRDYDRTVDTATAGVPTLPASADRHFRGEPDRWNPELLLLAALSQCHLLSYLHCCATEGVVVVAYTDRATATMTEDGHGGGAFTEAVLHPRVTVADATMTHAAQRLHHRASELCFIASSVSFPVRHEPHAAVAGDEAPAESPAASDGG